MVNVKNSKINPFEFRIRYGEQNNKYTLIIKQRKRQVEATKRNIVVVINERLFRWPIKNHVQKVNKMSLSTFSLA